MASTKSEAEVGKSIDVMAARVAETWVKKLLEQVNAKNSIIHRDLTEVEQNGGLSAVLAELRKWGLIPYTQGDELLITDKEIEPLTDEGEE